MFRTNLKNSEKNQKKSDFQKKMKNSEKSENFIVTSRASGI